MKYRINWKRTLGPTLSIVLHVGVVWILLHTLGFVSKPKEEVIQFKVVEAPEINLDEILPVEPPELQDDITSPEPLTAEQVAALSNPDDLNVSTDFDDSFAMLDNLSPLTIQGVGADLSSQGTLTRRYGDRALRNGLLGSYFNRVDFTGETLMRIDETLNYQWELESAWPGKVRPELFSIIWTGRLVPPRTGEYTLYLQSDDGARLWIDGQLVLDQFVERERQVDEVKIRMLVGKSYDIKYVFCDVYQHAISRLEWSCEEAGIPRQLVPSEHMWADGASTRQLMAWNEEVRRGTSVQYPNRTAMRNPAMIEGAPFSHIVGYRNLSPEALARLQLDELIADWTSFSRNNRAPAAALLPAMPPGAESERAQPAGAGQDVIITIF